MHQCRQSLLARSVGRSRELAIRVALGATRWRIVRQLLAESGLLALAAGTLGFGFTLAGVWLFTRAVTGITFPYYIQWTIDGRVGRVYRGRVCRRRTSRWPAPGCSGIEVGGSIALEEGEKTATSGMGRRRMTTALLTIGGGIDAGLARGAGLMMRSFLGVYRADSIVDAARVVAMPVSLPAEKYRTAEQRTAAYQRLEERLDGIPGVSSTAFANVVPFAGGPSRQMSVEDGDPCPAKRSR